MQCSGHTSLDFMLLLIDHLVSLIVEALTLLASISKVYFGQNQLPVVFCPAYTSNEEQIQHFAAPTPSGFKVTINEEKKRSQRSARVTRAGRSFISDYFLIFCCGISLCSSMLY